MPEQRKFKGPCGDCEKRHPGCHSKCPEYLEWKDYRKAISEREQQRLLGATRNVKFIKRTTGHPVGKQR